MLTAAIGRSAYTAPLFEHPDDLDLQPFPVITRAFAPMVREQRFDVSELAIATFLQARAFGSDLVLLPVTLSARYQTAALLRRADDPFGPEALRSRRIGVRAYSQTTGMWLRGILHDTVKLLPQEMRWTTFEDAHVAGYAEPAWARRAPPGAELLAMLRAGQIDAAIVGNDMPDDPALAPVFPNLDAAAQAFHDTHGFVPVNHLVVLRREVAARPGVARALLERFRAARATLPPETRAHLPLGRKALEPALALALRYCTAQGLLPRPLTLADAWAGLPQDAQEPSP